MADRSIKVRLSAEVSDFTREMGKASTSLDQLVKKSGDASGASNTTMGRLAQSARLQSDAWNTAGSSLLGVGAAITGVNVAVAKTGIEYNTLQQTSRAALTTMLGSTEAVNAQMDKLDDFARTSPFSKSTFITAQQQMLAFGIEAEKVVPYLSAINDATAAAGGNNQTLSELAFIMAQISAAGKITAQDLMQFGQRGVNAAELIGSQMGKTGAQIRDDITNGALDAGTALDALAAGMSERFEGASANVKDTMAGAFDRVKAAFRDLSADIMSSAVSPDGGGWFVDMTNGVADLMRAVQRLPDPVKSATAAISGITGVAALAGGGVLLAVPKFVQLHDAFKTLSEVSPRLTDGLKAVGKAAGIAMGALAVLTVINSVATSMEAAATGADNAEAAFKRFAAGAGDLDSVFQKINGKPLFSAIGQQVDDLDSAFERFATRGIRHMDQLDGFMNGLTGGESALSRLHDQFALLDTQLTSMSTTEAAAAFTHLAERAEVAGVTIDDLLELFPQYAGQIQLLAANHGLAELSGQELVDAMKGLNPELAAAADAAQEAATGASEFAAEQEEAAASAEALRADVEAVRESLNNYYSAAVAASDATIAVEAAFDKASDAAEKNGKTLDLNTEAGRSNQSALNDIVGAAERQIKAMREAGDSTDDMTAATQRARDEFIKAAQQMGLNSDEASNLADKYGLIPEQVVTRLEQPGMEMSQEEAQRYRELLANLPPEVRTTIRTIPDLSGYYDVDRALNRIAGRTVTTYVAMKQYGQGAVATGGRVGDTIPQLADGGSPRWVGASGRVFGPGSPTADKVSAWISPDEFVLKERAAKHYGYGLMYALNAMQIPRDAFKPYGYAGGGTPSAVERTYSAPRSMPSAAATLTTTARLDPADIDRLAHTIVGVAQGVSSRTVDSAFLALGRGV